MADPIWRKGYRGMSGNLTVEVEEGIIARTGPYLELFARDQRLGWDTWGDQALCHVQLKPRS